jgi:hypothetical protein
LSTFSLVSLYTFVYTPSICSIENFTHNVLYRWSWLLRVRNVTKKSTHGVAIIYTTCIWTSLNHNGWCISQNIYHISLINKQP